MRPRSPVVVTALLAALTAVPPVTINLYLPSLPSMVADLGTTVAMVQLTVTSFFFAFAAGQLLYGPLSDRFGRRPLLVGALVVYLVGGIGCSLAPTVELLVAARLVQAIGACGAPVLARAVVVDLYGREHAARVLAYIGAAMGIVPAFGPWLGGIIETHLGWRASFWLMVVLSVLLLVGTLLLLHESNRRSDRYALGPARMLRNYGDLLRQRVFVVLPGDRRSLDGQFLRHRAHHPARRDRPDAGIRHRPGCRRRAHPGGLHLLRDRERPDHPGADDGLCLRDGHHHP